MTAMAPRPRRYSAARRVWRMLTQSANKESQSAALAPY